MSKDEAKQNKLKLAGVEVKTILESFLQLIEALSLILVSAFSIHNARTVGVGKYWCYPVLVAGCVIAVRGAWEFIKYLRKRG